MFKIILTVDPQTRRALYDSESKVLGIFNSLPEADSALGDLMKYCSIRSA